MDLNGCRGDGAFITDPIWPPARVYVSDVHVHRGGREADEPSASAGAEGDAVAGDGVVRRGTQWRGSSLRQTLRGRGQRARGKEMKEK